MNLDFLRADLLLQLEYLLRLVLSAILGAAIGVEREKRGKEAGIRTHLIVTLASCLMMLVSKYGFNDVLGLNNVGLDPSRVAAGIVSGVGFLGAGIIFVRGRAVNGLTTAAGIWATVGVGMAVGAGMYVVSIATAAFIVVFQALLHKDLPFLRNKGSDVIRIRMDDRGDALALLSQALGRSGIRPVSLKAERQDDGTIFVFLETEPAENQTLAEEFSPLLAEEFVHSVEW
ncbi:MAG: MgtC/SapB family protein [Clostridia bacterium]|nr:MgtC/SapB family protein [Clostridia bacterium]